MAERTRRVITRRRFLGLTAAELLLLASCDGSGQKGRTGPATSTKPPEFKTCPDISSLDPRTPYVDADPKSGISGITFVDKPKNPEERGARFIMIQPDVLLTKPNFVEISKILESPLRIGTGVILERDHRTLAVRGESKYSTGDSIWTYNQEINPANCTILSAFWEKGRIVDAQINQARPADLRIRILDPGSL